MFSLTSTQKILSNAVLILTLLAITIAPSGIIAPANAVSGSQVLAQEPRPTPRIMEDVSTPIQAVLSIDHYPLVGQTATLTCEISSVLDASATTAEIELPTNARLLSGDLNWQGNLLAGNPIEFVATVVFEATGDTAIFCRARRVIDPENSWGDMAELYLSIGQTESLAGFAAVAAEDRYQLGELVELGDGQVIDEAEVQSVLPSEGQAVEPPPSVAPSSSDETPVASTEVVPLQGDLTVTGRWGYYDRDDHYTPALEFIVELVQGDNGNHLAWCYTDTAGYYSCGPVTNPDSAGVRTVMRSYVKYNPYDDVLAVVNPDWGTSNNVYNTFGTQTGVTVFPDGTHDIGSWVSSNGSTYERAYWIQRDLNDTWRYIWLGTGSSQSPQETAGPGTVQWKIDSTDGTYYDRGGNIHLEGADPLSDCVVSHEYGHNIMYTVYGNWMPTTYCPSPHYVQLSSHVNCAWTEGWANFLPLAVNNDPNYRWASGSSLNLETPTWGTFGWDEGDDVEGRVAGALWDILDTNNDGDDQYSDGGIVNIWDTLYHQNDNNFSEYWSAWKSRGHNNTSAGPVMAIYQNTIDYRNGPANDDFANATVIGSLPFTVLNLNTANATTQGNDPITSCGSTSTPKQSRSVWYRYTPATTGNYTITTDGSNYDTVLAIWTGTFGSLTDRGCDDDGGSGLQSFLTLTLNSGTTYYIEAMCYSSGSGGQLTLNVSSGSPVDVYLLIDLSGSFSDDLPVFKAQAPGIVSTLRASYPSIRFGLGKFEDYPINPFGSAADGDKAYERLVDLTSDTNLVLNTIDGLFVRYGMDTPESQLVALYQAATGAGQDLSGVGYPGASIPPGQQANFRDVGTKLFLLWTDAPFHLPGDPGDIPYPGPSFNETVDAILALDPPKVIGVFSSGLTSSSANQGVQELSLGTGEVSALDGLSDLEAIARATGALAPADGVDCDGDGTIDLAPGQPLVCGVSSSGEGIGEAIVALVEAGTKPAVFKIHLPTILKNF